MDLNPPKTQLLKNLNVFSQKTTTKELVGALVQGAGRDLAIGRSDHVSFDTSQASQRFISQLALLLLNP